jgi:uncharacterized damage-inducible protein DinB
VSDQDAERAALLDVLDLQRGALINKLSGLSEQDACTAATASSLTLLSIVKHSAVWERRWFQVLLAGRRFPNEWPDVGDSSADATFDLRPGDTIDAIVADYRRQIAAASEVLATVDLDAPCADAAVADMSARAVVLHMIEETARHAGHADIIRETIDGAKGRWAQSPGDW